MNTILSIVFISSASILFLSLSILSLYKIKYLKNKSDALDYTNTMETKIDLSCVELLDGIIKDIFDEYILMNISLNSEKNMYINSDTEIQICREVSDKVIETLSVTLLQKLSAVYSMEIIPEIISKKVYFMTTEYVVNNNSVLQNEE